MPINSSRRGCLPWSAADDDTLRRVYPLAGARAAAEALGRSRGAVYIRAHTLRLVAPTRKGRVRAPRRAGTADYMAARGPAPEPLPGRPGSIERQIALAERAALGIELFSAEDTNGRAG